MDKREPPHFSQPLRQVAFMLLVLALVGAGAYVGFPILRDVYLTNVYLNGAIAFVFLLGILLCARQVVLLSSSVSWIKGFARQAPGEAPPPAPSLLGPLSTLLRTRGARMQLTSTATRSILDSVAIRLDEDQEITSYLGNTLVLLGLLGTFWGLATTVPALVDTIRGLAPAEGESGADVVGRLQAGLESQLGGMGTAFSSSLLGLAGSLVIGLLALFVGHGQNRFARELEDWLASITRVGVAGAEGAAGEGAEAGLMAQVVDNLAEQMESLQMMFTQSDAARSQTDRRIGDLAGAMGRLAQRLEEGRDAQALARVAEGQDRLVEAIGRLGQIEAIDAESRARLRSIDVGLLRILEEIGAGRQESMAELRADIAGLARALRGARPRDGAPAP